MLESLETDTVDRAKLESLFASEDPDNVVLAYQVNQGIKEITTQKIIDIQGDPLKRMAYSIVMHVGVENIDRINNEYENYLHTSNRGSDIGLDVFEYIITKKFSNGFFINFKNHLCESISFDAKRSTVNIKFAEMRLMVGNQMNRVVWNKQPVTEFIDFIDAVVNTQTEGRRSGWDEKELPY